VLPRYPVYVPSRGRADYATALTVRFLLRDEVPFRVVVVPSEAGAYAELAGAERLLVLPSDDCVLRDARNWIKDHAAVAGHARHWQLDDNIHHIRRWYRGRRIPCAAGPALAAVEDFTDRYTNIAIAGLNYTMFAVRTAGQPAVVRNVHVYSCTLVDNAWPGRWRLVLNDDTDLCLQALADGLCTVLINVFLAFKVETGVVRGGNTDAHYQGDGRLRMARSLERVWPGVVTVRRRFGRPQHVVNWRRFDTPLVLRDDVDPAALGRDEYGLALRAVKPVRSRSLRDLQAEYNDAAL
jgi:hypothetical protein